MRVGAQQVVVIEIVHDHRGREVGPGCLGGEADEGNERHGEQAAGHHDDAERDQAVAVGFDDGVPAGVEQRGEEQNAENRKRHGDLRTGNVTKM